MTLTTSSLREYKNSTGHSTGAQRISLQAEAKSHTTRLTIGSVQISNMPVLEGLPMTRSSVTRKAGSTAWGCPHWPYPFPGCDPVHNDSLTVMLLILGLTAAGTLAVAFFVYLCACGRKRTPNDNEHVPGRIPLQRVPLTQSLGRTGDQRDHDTQSVHGSHGDQSDEGEQGGSTMATLGTVRT